MLAQLGFVTVEKVVEVWEFRLPLRDAISINLTKAATEKSAQWRRSYYPTAPALDAMNLHQAQNHDEKVRIAKAARSWLIRAKA